jgi:pilus assembly protein Flp/PilA
MGSLFRRFLVDERGATAIEYGLIVALIFLVIVSAVTLFSDRATAMFTYISTTIDVVL